jgi:hypothetical protein
MIGRRAQRSATIKGNSSDEGLAAEGQFDQALLVADQTIALAAGRSVLPGHRSGRRRGGLGAKITALAKLAKEDIVAVRKDADK